MRPMSTLIEISLFFPVYKDERTVEQVTTKSVKVLSQLTENWEILIIDDGTPDRAGVIADELAKKDPRIRVIHHEINLGYGAAIRRGLSEARGEWIYFTDGDDEYDVYEFLRMHKIRDFYDLVITFRYKKLYSSKRQFISNTYNRILRLLFDIRYRDISTGLRGIRKSLAEHLELSSNSPFIGAELTIKSDLKGYRIGEMGIQTFPREFGQGNSTSFKNIKATIRDMIHVYRQIFSASYDLPENRDRK